jgi:hypothetical protein
MQSNLLTMTASAGLALIFLTTLPANSITIATSLVGVQQASDALELTEAVHCRTYPHRHRRGHGWSHGCRVEAEIVRPRRSHRGRSVTTVPGIRAPSAAGIRAPSAAGRSPSNFINPSNPQDRSGSSNRQDLTQPRAINPQDMR